MFLYPSGGLKGLNPLYFLYKNALNKGSLLRFQRYISKGIKNGG